LYFFFNKNTIKLKLSKEIKKNTKQEQLLQEGTSRKFACDTKFSIVWPWQLQSALILLNVHGMKKAFEESCLQIRSGFPYRKHSRDVHAKMSSHEMRI